MRPTGTPSAAATAIEHHAMLTVSDHTLTTARGGMDVVAGADGSDENHINSKIKFKLNCDLVPS
jgi:hypothetical protein